MLQACTMLSSTGGSLSEKDGGKGDKALPKGKNQNTK